MHPERVVWPKQVTKIVLAPGGGPSLILRSAPPFALVKERKTLLGRLKMVLASTSVHNIETKDKSTLPPSFHDFKKAIHLAEWSRVFEVYSDIDESEHTNRAESLTGCRSFAYFARHTETGMVKVISSACHLRWCPICVTAKAAQISVSVEKWLQKSHSPKMLTLTLQHSSAPLESQILNLYNSFRTLRLRTPFARAIRGGIWFFQLKWIPESDEWHPHIHAVMDGDYLPQAWLSDEWLKITKTSQIVDIRKIYKIQHAAKHIARYCAQPCKLQYLPFVRAREVVKAMAGKRMCGCWGTGKDCHLGSIKSLETQEWKCIGSWNTVQGMSLDTDDAKAIILAWQTGIPLSNDIDLNSVDDFIIEKISAVAAIAEQYHMEILYNP